MDLFQALVLGLVQGLTEFLPISSTAHLRVFPALLGWADPGAAFSAVIQLGTLGAVIVYYWRDLSGMVLAVVRGLLRGRPFAEFQARLGWMLVLATIPIAVVGLLFQDQIDTVLRSLWVVAGALVGLALILLLAEWQGQRRKILEQTGWGDALIVGLAQALALVPGASRSGVTMTAGLFLGYTRAEAARFSFLLSVPAIGASGIYKLISLLGKDLEGTSWSAIGVATAAAFVSGYGAIAFLIRFLCRHSTGIFIGYRILLGGAIATLLACGLLLPLG